jgi:manganese peroxidase
MSIPILNRLLISAAWVLSSTLVLAQNAPSSCPSVWTDVANDLKGMLVGGDGVCNDAARASLRLAFHDCFPGACDGSIIVTDECMTRPENELLRGLCDTLGKKAEQFKVSAADIIQLSAGKLLYLIEHEPKAFICKA